jgi:hypothetical protein
MPSHAAAAAAVVLLFAAAAQASRLAPGFKPPPKTQCHGGPCGGMAHYPTAPGIAYYAEFDVPGMPKKMDGICYYIYFNIFFSGKGHGRMNQFVPQLMLGNSLTSSSGPPAYKPKWVHHDSWVFSSQYFMEINNTKSGNAAEGHAATGEAYPAKVNVMRTVLGGVTTNVKLECVIAGRREGLDQIFALRGGTPVQPVYWLAGHMLRVPFPPELGPQYSQGPSPRITCGRWAWAWSGMRAGPVP